MNTTKKRPTAGEMIKEAFSYWNRTLLYQIVFSLIFFSILFLVTYVGAIKYGLMDAYAAAIPKMQTSPEAYLEEMRKISSSEGYRKFYWIFTLCLVFLYPLNLGFFKIYRKIDLKEKYGIEDLFAGYRGINFFIYASFYLFWLMIFYYTLPTIFLAVIWVLVTLFCAPLMFFMNKQIFEGIRLSFSALRLFPLEIILCSVVAVAFKYFGLITFFGALFTMPFWNAMIYALYKNIFSEIKK